MTTSVTARRQASGGVLRRNVIERGLSVAESAEVLGVSPVTVMRDWRTAKAWLYRELSSESSDG